MVRKATVSDARAVHHILSAIPWIAESAKSEDGFREAARSCERGQVWVVETNAKIASIMVLRKDTLAESMGYDIWQLALIATVEDARRRGYARRLVRKAKETAEGGTITAQIKNEQSLSLLTSEGFVRVEGQSDSAGNPAYEWTAD